MAPKTQIVLIALGNRSCKLIPGAPLKLKDNLWVRTIEAGQLGAIIGKRPVYQSLISGNSKCIIHESYVDKFDQASLEKFTVPACFAMNFFGSKEGLKLSNGFLLERSRGGAKLISEVSLDGPTRAEGDFSFATKTTPAQVSQLFSIAS